MKHTREKLEETILTILEKIDPNGNVGEMGFLIYGVKEFEEFVDEISEYVYRNKG